MSDKIKLGVSLFSYSYLYYLFHKNLNELLVSAKNSGAGGIEIVAAQMVPGYPYPSEQWLENFRNNCLALGLEPFCYSAHLDSGLYTGRNMDNDEMIRSTVNDLHCAYYMGASIVRTQQVLSPALVYKIAPWAEKYRIKVGIEIHPPHHFTTPVWEEYIRVFRDIDSPYVGVCVDLGIYQEYPYEGWLNVYRKHGVPQETVDYLLHSLSTKVPFARAESELKHNGQNEYAMEMAKEMYALFAPYEPDVLKDIMKYVTHFHTKFYHIQDGEEKTIPYREIFKIVKDSGFTGYLCSEYEGHYVYKEDEVPCEEQIRQHILMEKLSWGIP